jgi:hypothetical protein
VTPQRGISEKRLMTLSELGSIGEIVGGIGVVISLLYVGFQVRQNTRSSRASSIQAARQMGIEFHNLLAQPEMTDVYIKGLSDYPSMPEKERVQFQSLMNTLFNYFETLYFNKRDIEQREITNKEMQNMIYHLSQPGVRKYWNQMGSLHAPDFVNWLNNRLDERAT